MIQSRLARPIIQNISKRTAVLPASASEFRYIWFFWIFDKWNDYSRPAIVDVESYVYPGNPSYPGMGPQAMPEEWNRDDKVVLYVIPKTFADWLAPKMGESAVYTTLYTGVFALMSKVSLSTFLLIVSKVLEKCANKILLGNPLLPRWGFGSLRFLDDLVIHQLDCWQGYLPSSRWEAHRRVWPPLCRQGARLGWLVSLTL